MQVLRVVAKSALTLHFLVRLMCIWKVVFSPIFIQQGKPAGSSDTRDLACRFQSCKVLNLIFDSTSREIPLPEQAALVKVTFIYIQNTIILMGNITIRWTRHSFYDLCVLSLFAHLQGKLNNVRSMLDENGVRARS